MSTRESRHAVTHDRIVEAAARTLRSRGAAGVGVADVMQQVGLTHGGFYAHFESRDALLAEALERAGRDGGERLSRQIAAGRARGDSPLRALVEAYLSDEHLGRVESGCVVAALGSDLPRLPPTLSAPSVARVDGLISRVRRALPAGSSHEQAMVIASTLVGALQLARALHPRPRARALLAATRRALLAPGHTD